LVLTGLRGLALLDVAPHQQWLSETQESHPTLTSAAAYFEVSADWSSTDLRTRPRPPQIYPIELPTLTLLAVEAFAEIVGIADQLLAPLADIRQRIEKLGAEAHVTPDSKDSMRNHASQQHRPILVYAPSTTNG